MTCRTVVSGVGGSLPLLYPLNCLRRVMHTEVGRTHLSHILFLIRNTHLCRQSTAPPIDLITEPCLLYRDVDHYELRRILSVMLPTFHTVPYRDTSRRIILTVQCGLSRPHKPCLRCDHHRSAMTRIMYTGTGMLGHANVVKAFLFATVFICATLSAQRTSRIPW